MERRKWIASIAGIQTLHSEHAYTDKEYEDKHLKKKIRYDHDNVKKTKNDQEMEKKEDKALTRQSMKWIISCRRRSMQGQRRWRMTGMRRWSRAKTNAWESRRGQIRDRKFKE